MSMSSPFFFVAEDSDNDFQLLRRVLRKHKYNDVERVVSGEAAISRLRDIDALGLRIPDIIIMDIELRPTGYSGEDVSNRIKALPRVKHAPLIAYSHNAHRLDLIKQVDYKLLKGFADDDLKVFLDIIENHR